VDWCHGQPIRQDGQNNGALLELWSIPIFRSTILAVHQYNHRLVFWDALMSASGKQPEADAAPNLTIHLSPDIEPLVHEGYKNCLLASLDQAIAQLGDAAALS
jgi:hypothetical protein